MPESNEVEISRILKQHRAALVRTKRHNVWKFPDGRIFTTAQSPSDFRASNNQLRDLKRLLGLNGVRGVAGERRVPQNKPGVARPSRVTASVDSVLQEKLRMVGLVEDGLKVKLATLAIELRESRAANHRKKIQLRQVNEHCVRCLGCRLRRWWRRIQVHTLVYDLCRRFALLWGGG